VPTLRYWQWRGSTRTENPRVGGSIPPLAAKTLIKINRLARAAPRSKNLSYKL
jgi:hypothetical protein